MSSRAFTDGARAFGLAEVVGRIAGVRWRWGAAGGQLAGWALVAAVNAVFIAVTPLPRTGAGIRALHHAYDAGQLLALGVLSAAAVMLWQRVRPGSRALDAAAIFACAAGLGGWMLVDDFDGFAGDLVGDGRAWLVIALGVTACALGVPLAALAGRRFARGRLRLVAAGAAVSLAAANHLVAAHDYPGVHFFVAWWAAVLAGTASSTALGLSARGSARWLLAPAALSLWSLVFPPSNRVRLELSRFSGAVVAPWRARLETHFSPSPAALGQADGSAWFRSRKGLPDIPPSSPQLFAKDAIVLLLVIDAARADLTDPKYEATFPNLTRLRKSSVELTNARSAAPGTAFSITSLFTSRYPVQIEWADVSGRPFPYRDKSVRFSEILQARGVTTVSLQGMLYFRSAYGILRGFDEEAMLDRGSSVLVPALMQRLERVGKRPLFAYQHYDDGHSPYTSAGEKATPFEGYLAGLAEVDRQLGRLLDFLDARGLAERTTLIVTADHGEAFGEHGKYFHATTVYDELLRVPLIVRVPGVPPGRRDEPVTLVDLAPTILDGFGFPTPGSYMGQSLVPLLRGQRVALRRPIVAESERGHRAMLFDDGLKLIADDRLHTLELFDLGADPGENENLADSRPADAAERRARLEAFFAARRSRR